MLIFHRQVFRHHDVLRHYLRGEEPNYTTIKRGLYLQERAVDSRRPDHFLRQAERTTTGSYNDLPMLLSGTLGWLASHYLTRASYHHLCVPWDRFAEWQDAITGISPLLIVARASAIQNGSEARFIRSGNVVRVTVDSSGTSVTLISRDLYREHGVTFTTGGAARDTVRFDPRGVAIGLTGAAIFKFTNATVKDSICVTKLGKVSRTGCG